MPRPTVLAEAWHDWTARVWRWSSWADRVRGRPQ